MWKCAAWISAFHSYIYLKYVGQGSSINHISSDSSQISYTSQTSNSSPKRGPISLRNCLLAAIAIYAVYLLFGYLLRDDPKAVIFYADWAAVGINAIAALSLLYAAHVSLSAGRKAFFAWLMMAAGQLCFVLGDAIWAYIETIQMKNPFPSLADVPNLMTFPLFMIGILLLPSSPVSIRERITMALDTGIVIISSIIVFWSLIIEPRRR